jgi:hypothetical protein
LIGIGHSHDLLLEEIPAVAYYELGAIFIDAGTGDPAVADGPAADVSFHSEEVVLVLHLLIL